MKPFKGTMHNWERVFVQDKCIITGDFGGHPEFHGRSGHTSVVLSEYHIAGNHFVETMNSLYLLGTKKGARHEGD